MKYETKKIFLDEKYEIIDGNREYFIYFERVGHRFSKIEELVLPSEKKAFMNFIHGNSSSENFEVFHFKKYTDEYRLNRAKIGYEFRNGKKVLSLSLIDIEEAFNFIEKAVIEEDKQRFALSIMEDMFFSYEKESNEIKIIHYHDGKCYVDFNLDIDDWKEQMIEEKYLPKDQIPIFEKMVSDIKACLSKLFVSLKCGFRSDGKIMQTLNFFATRFVSPDGKITVIGRIVHDSKAQDTQNTNDLIAELQFDSLTKCYNKKTILDYAIKRIKECGKDEKFAIVIVDLDNFKTANDAYGHLAGDRILEQTGEVLLSIFSDKGYVGRYGGDEFLLVLNQMNSEEILRGSLQTILNNIRSKFENAFDDIMVTPSIGAAVYPDDGKDFNELFNKADFCLYRAKDKGRNRYVFFRNDLHLELYKKSVESTSGVKYQGREFQELMYLANFMNTLSESPFKAIKEIMEHMVHTYNLEDLTIYYGEDLKRIYASGNKHDEQENALYAKSKAFKLALKKSRFVRVDFPEDIASEAKELKDELSRRGIKSTIQCILGSEDDIRGLITFDKTKECQQWAEYEVNCAVMFSSIFNLLPETTKVDFALYNRI